MQWSTLVATAVGTVLGALATLAADHIRWRRDRSERDHDTLRTAFTEYLTTLSAARDAFSRTEPDPERVGQGHVAIGEHGVYAAQQQLELVAQRTLVDKAGRTTLSVLDFHDAVVAGHGMNSQEYNNAWRAARQSRSALIEEMRNVLQRTK
ncbi:hypothetical protein A6A06_22420 [Streptomyces sp. CB02923]|uniref:hypothetical protein n=1 Tax=Streptomyces sp. CB02923 TaxID=1718985 RepID=UPI00093C323A|nr:hypothetical protein [Streptomyces sp. CB02923]OKH99824.1 hypothetical protein A6A06_22420 [Streptomyces sp. CB02923]